MAKRECTKCRAKERRRAKRQTGKNSPRIVAGKKSTICMCSDGFAMLGDVDSIIGLVKMLKAKHGDNNDEADLMREGYAVKVGLAKL